MPEFPSLNQREMAAFLGIDPKRLERATNAGIVTRSAQKLYPLEIATREWLAYERRQREHGTRRSEMERQKVRLMRVKAEMAERKLAVLDDKWTETDTVLGTFGAVCARIRTKFQSSLARLARGCYYAKGLREANDFAGQIFEELLGELSALSVEPIAPLEVVREEEPEEPKDGVL